MEKLAKTRYMKWLEESSSQQEFNDKLTRLVNKTYKDPKDAVFWGEYVNELRDSIRDAGPVPYANGLERRTKRIFMDNPGHFRHISRAGDVRQARSNMKFVVNHVSDNTGSVENMIEKHQKNIQDFKALKEVREMNRKNDIAKKKQQILDRRNNRLSNPSPFSKLQEAENLAVNKPVMPQNTGIKLSRNAKIGLGLGAGALALGAGAYGLSRLKNKKKQEIEKKAMEV